MRVLLCTHSRDRGSTSRTLEAWTRLLPLHGVTPAVTIGGDGPLLTALTAAGVPTHVHNIKPMFDARRPHRFLGAVARLALRIKSSGADLVHVNEHETYPVVSRAAYLARVPVAVHIRFKPDAAMCQWLFKPPYVPGRLFFTSQTQMNDSADAVSGTVPRDRWRLVYNGLQLDAFGLDEGARTRLRTDWKLSPSTIAIGTASSISPRKRLDHFVRLIATLNARGLDVQGFIAGQPYFPEDERELLALRALVASLHLEKRVHFLGYVEPSEPLYHAWDLCISTSAYETFGMTMLEAMACGCPVIAYPGGSVSEVIGDGGLIVNDGDEQALADVAERLTTSERARHDMAGAARTRARTFDIRRSVEQLAIEYAAMTKRQR